MSLVACLIFAGCSDDEPDHEADLFSLAVQLEGEGELAMGIHDCEIIVPGNQQYISIDIIGDYDCFRVTAVPDIGMVTSGDKRIKILLTNNLGETSQTGTLEFTVYKGKSWNKGTVTVTQRALSSTKPDEPEELPDKYRFKLVKAGLTPFMYDDFRVPAPLTILRFKFGTISTDTIPLGFRNLYSRMTQSYGVPRVCRIQSVSMSEKPVTAVLRNISLPNGHRISSHPEV